ncbi:hypothetical protein ACHAQJ_004097 [Trichoderma viride]
MLPDELWPVLFLISLFICIGILVCLTFTVFGIILKRHTEDEETQYRLVVEDDSPEEGYYTFERSFDDDPINGQGRTARIFIIPKKQKFHAEVMRGGVRSKPTRYQ